MNLFVLYVPILSANEVSRYKIEHPAQILPSHLLIRYYSMLSEILETIKKNLFLIFLIALISLLSFQLGRISKEASQPIKIEKASVLEIQNSKFKDQNLSNTETESGGVGQIDFRAKSIQELDRSPDSIEFRVVVSKKSTSNKYHFLWCPGAKQIKEENKIFFNSEQEALSAGYALAGNCTK